VLVSQATRDLVGKHFELRDVGEHRLKDLESPERLYQLGEGEFPPVKSGRHGGVEVHTEGDAFFVAFQRASDGLAAAAEARRALRDGPVRAGYGFV
jgi:class 3 adenylate cyclase